MWFPTKDNIIQLIVEIVRPYKMSEDAVREEIRKSVASGFKQIVYEVYRNSYSAKYDGWTWGEDDEVVEIREALKDLATRDIMKVVKHDVDLYIKRAIEKLNREEFIDSIVDRINRKQVGK